MIPIPVFAGETVAIFGLGRSGRPATRALTAGGALVRVWDDDAERRAVAAAEGFALADLGAVDLREFAALVLAPGVPLTHPRPHPIVERARAAGV
jgi:UDP-N-acetylmuramoylalanine--D-glutamate ligase